MRPSHVPQSAFGVLDRLAALPFEDRRQFPIWQQIADRIAHACQNGEFMHGQRLPAENQMASAFGVTRVTIRRALANLQASGVLHARKGVGVFVRSVQRVDYGNRFMLDQSDSGAVASVHTLSVSWGDATDDEAEALDIPPGAPVIRLIRVRQLDNVPRYLTTKIFPGHLFPVFETAYEPRSSIRDVYRANRISRFRRMEMRVTGGFATAAEAAALHLSPQAAVIYTTMINVDDLGRRIEFNRGAWPLAGVELVLDPANVMRFDEVD